MNLFLLGLQIFCLSFRHSLSGDISVMKDGSSNRLLSDILKLLYNLYFIYTFLFLKSKAAHASNAYLYFFGIFVNKGITKYLMLFEDSNWFVCCGQLIRKECVKTT